MACDEIISVTNSVSTNVTNTISTIVTSIVSINSDHKKIRYKMDCYILHTFLVVTNYYLWLSLSAVIAQNMGQNKKMKKN